MFSWQQRSFFFAYQFWFKRQRDIFKSRRLCQDLPRGIYLLFSRFILLLILDWHTAFQKSICQLWHTVWYGAESSRGNSEILKQAFPQNLEAHTSRIKKYFSIIFASRFLKSVPTFNNIFKFKKCGISNELSF